jgi:hypothetical protein
MALLEDSGTYGSPNAVPDHPGKPTLQLAAEAMDRCHQRDEWRRDHSMEMGPDDWAQRSADYEMIERAGDLLGDCGARTFEPGDGFMFKGGK